MMCDMQATSMACLRRVLYNSSSCSEPVTAGLRPTGTRDPCSANPPSHAPYLPLLPLPPLWTMN